MKNLSFIVDNIVEIVKILKAFNLVTWVSIVFLLGVNYGNIKVMIGSYDISNSPKLLTILLIGFLILLFINFISKIKTLISLGFFILAFLVNLYVILQLVFWLLNTPEGIINYKIFHIIKMASYEAKLELYLQHISILIDNIQHIGFKEFVIKTGLANNPPQQEILISSLASIPELAQSKLVVSKILYEKALVITNITPKTDSYIKYYIAGGLAAITLVAVGFYFLSGPDVLPAFKSILRFGKASVKAMDVQVSGLTNQAASDLDAASASKLIKELSTKVSNLAAEVIRLNDITGTLALQSDVVNITQTLNVCVDNQEVLRKIFKHLYTIHLPNLTPKYDYKGLLGPLYFYITK